MKRQMVFVPVVGVMLSGCGMINDSIATLQENRQAVDASTCAIYENIQAIEQANRGIEENRRQLEAINESLRKASES